MIEFATTLDKTFGSPIAQMAVFLMVAIGIGVAFLTTSYKRSDRGSDADRPHRRYFRLSAAFVMLTVISVFVVFEFVKNGANEDIDEKLKSGVIPVHIDGVLLHQPGPFIHGLTNPCFTSHRRSHPTTRYEVNIQTRSGSLMLRMGLDSRINTDYWIFYPKFRLTQMNEVRRACNTGMQLS